MDYIIYNGIDSRVFGVYLARRGKTPLVFNSIPPSRVKTQKIAGKHGTIAVEETYEPRQVNMQLYFTDTSSENMVRVGNWLGKIGTHKLLLSTESYKFYNATFEQGMNPDIYGSKQGIVDITFTCYDPFGYSGFTTLELESGGIEYDSGLIYDIGLEYADLASYSYTEIVNDADITEVLQGGNADFALPKIIVTANVSGAGGFKLEHFYGGTDPEHKIGEMTYSNSIPSNGSVIVDSQTSEAYDENGIILSSYLSDDDFFKFKGVGNPDFQIKGGAINITDTTIQLDSNASAVDDVYNNMTISLNGNDEMRTQYAKITDYDGTTKIATISNSIEIGINKSFSYGIYDFSKKLNYVKYSYSSPVVAQPVTIAFDFRFNYL